MEIINPNSLPGDNSRNCSTDALMPPHAGGGGGASGGCGHFCSALVVPDPCLEKAG